MPVEFSKPDEEGRSMYFSDGNLTGGDQLLQEVAGHCGCTVADIEDVYPCTPLQEGMFALTLRDSVAYNVGYKYRLPIGIDTVRLRTAWKRTAETNPILRTRIVPTSERGCMQVVLRRNILWTEKENSETNDERLLADGDNMTNPESPETRVQSVWPAGSPMVKLMWDPVAHDLTVVIHHALCDDWSMAIVLRQVAAAYSGKTLAMRPFRPLIEFIQQAQPDASAFWSTKFHNLSHADVSVFPLHAKAAYVPQPTAILRQKFRQPANSRAEFALNAKVRLAWAVLQWLYTFSSEVLFGAIDSGRAIPLPGIEELSGPALVCVPVYVRLNPSQTVTEALDMVQREWAESMEFEHAGLQNIMRLGAGPAAACRFQTLLTVEPCDAHGLPELFLQQQSLQPVYDTYPLIVRWRSSPQSQSMTIEAMFDPHVLDTRQTERIVHQLAHIYQQIERKPHDVLKELDVCSPADIHDLASWNLPVPTMVQDGVQRLIEQQVQRSPQAMAVHSWNGSLTYHELDTSSSALGVALTHRGVRCRTVVPLCLQRSKWPAIAMIAAMKAGAAFVLLDESYPIARLRQMCKDVKATIVVGTKPTTGLASQLGLDLIAVDELDWEDLPRQRNDCAAAFPHCQGSSAEDLMYITFTSGSTGTPKGVLVSHGGFATSALFHAPKYNFTSSSRVLQFASPGFDSFIIEHLSTLMAGGCVCVPHPDDCRSRLGAVINEFSVNNACLTPTVARVLSADSPTTLLDLTLVGEAATANDVARWPSELHIRNAYGPAECSAVFSVQPHLVPEHPSNIGFPTGGVGWVTDPYDPHRLMPVGSIGELLIEGPIVGPGYASDTDATQRAFINPPVWRERYFGPCPGRMYRTGDLVQSAGDGSFRYVRRKDTQVKLHGQRIELAEIEHHLKTTAFPHASQVVADIVQLQEKPDITPVSLLIAFVCWSDVAQVSKESKRPGTPFLIASEQHRDSCAAGEMQLSAVLPPFMIPRTYLPLDHLPQTVSGKLDRRSLREHASQLTWEDLQSYRSSVKPSKKPQTATESLLQKIWAQVLNVPVDRLSVAENFFHLGGDSVSAMQVAAGCQREGLAVGVAQIFQFPTVEQLAQHAIPIVRETSPRRSSSPTAFHDEVNQTASLGLSSPIQQLFFELCPQGHNRFTQQFLLQVSKPQRASRVREAMESLVARHAILGARFEKLAKVGWSQVVPDGVRPRFSFREHILNGIGNGCMREILENSQNSLDITAGRLVAVDLINTPAHCQYLSLMVHHLVVDLVSWRILLQELEELLTTGALPGPKPMSFQRWCYLQECFVRRSLAPEKALPVEIPPQSLEYWGDDVCAINQNIWADTRQESFTVSEATTRAILGSANEALRTRPVELLHAALVYSFVQAFDDREAPTVFAEGHGREPWDPAMDLSRTVGWFTTMAPLFIRTSRQHDLGTVVQQIKEGRRAIPFNGWAYFASRFLHPEGRERWGDHIPMEILFNYTGLFQQLENPKALLQLAALPDHEILPMAADLPRFALIDASVTVVDGRLSASLIYNRRMQHQGKLHQWVGEYQRTLEELPTALKEYRRFTLSDFPLLSMDSSECLAELMQDIQSRFHIRTQDIEDIYPCSSIQLGIWLSQSKDPRTYWSRLCWSIRPTNPADTMLSPSRVKQAWQQVVDRHPILRTVLLVSPYTDGQPLQVVLRHAVAEIYEQDLKVPSSTAESCQFDDGTMHYSPLGHRLRISVNANGEIPCELVINHLLIDGFTRDILVSDLQLAYDGQLPSFTAAPFSRYLTRLRCQSEADSRAYWTRYLHGVQPCLFPRLDGKLENEQDILHSVTIDFDPLQTQSILRFCEQHATTIASMLQIAWGLVLRAYTGSDSVCFGYMVSARDIPLPGLQEIAGPLINLLVCRLSFDDKDDIHKTISNSQAAYAQNLDHRFCSLTEIIHGLGHTVPRLFNTAMSLQRERVMSPQRAPSVVVQQQGGQDSTEYDLTVNLTVRKETLQGELTYRSSVASHKQARLVADSLACILQRLSCSPEERIGLLDLLGPANEKALLHWNRQVPDTAPGCIHTTIRRQTLAQPSSLAVCAWDGNLTYTELDRLASVLALRLSEAGVGPDVFVPVCCEKSLWAVVAVMGVLKVGGAFILLDASQPMDRLQTAIKEDFPDSIILSTTSVSVVAAKISEKILLLDTLKKEEYVALDAKLFPVVGSPSTAAYAVYTSGSTGKPKASIIGHECFVTAATAHGKALGMGPGIRALQFASFAFDASIVEILTTLLMGGCVCVPSETDRSQKLADFIVSKRVNWALLTPSVSRVLEPREVHTLRTLVLGGEEVRHVDVQRWSPHVTVMNAYGPSECSVIATIQTSPCALLEDPCNIGHATGALAWVVDAQDPVRLVPVGAVGELVVEGPIVGRGYINRSEQTTAAFPVHLPWLKKVHRTGTSRFYRTGDLVRMLPDGSLRYEGRKDRQVKLHGQRVELSEVERHVRECFPDSQQLFAELVQCGDTGEQRLVAFVQLETLDEDQFDQVVSRAQDLLPRRIPSFLVPSTFVRLREVPRLPSGKVDRLQLRRDGLAAVQKTRSAMCHGSRLLRGDKPRALTSSEQRLQDMWAELLHLPTSKIDPGDHFFSLGGDSIMAMRLASSAPSHGMDLTVADVFLHPRLRDLARVLEGRGIQSLARMQGAADADPSPFSLLSSEREADIKRQAVDQCGVSPAQIEDIYPCTPMQAGLAAMSVKRPGAYIAHHAYAISPDTDTTRLRQAWDTVAGKHPILRTRLVRATNMGCLQVVIRNSPPQWKEVCFKSTEVSLAQVDRLPDPSQDGMFGVPLVHVTIRKLFSNDGVCFNCTMILTMHHAVYDAWSLPRLLSAVEKVYGQEGPNEVPKPAPFQRFIKYMASQTEAALKYWRAEFDDLSAEPFPGLPSSSYRPSAVSQLDQTFSTGSFTTETATRTTAVRLAWAVVQSQYQGQSDVVFGIVSSGRTAPVRDVQTMTSPTISAVPLRVRINPHMEFKGALAALQDWTVRVVPFEQAGLQQIARLGPNATRACSFQTLLNIEQGEESPPGQTNGLFISVETTAAKGAFATYALVLHCSLELQAVRVTAMFDDNIIPQWKMQRILDQFGHVLQIFHQGRLRFVRDAAGSLNSRDREQLIEWNSKAPHLVAETIPSAIRRQSDAQPDAQAVCAFDGDFTYRELEAWSDMLQDLLYSCHIQQGSFIPIYIDRSRWALIAMLGIVKAGAAFVLLDTSHPQSRLRTICDDIKAPLVVTSQDRLATARSLPAAAGPICVGECLNSRPRDLYTTGMESTLCHTDALYAMFTSGSTGKPKGVVIEHGALVTVTREYRQRVGLGPGARVLHFGSYAFDVSILETLCTLIAGACVCIPSESSRQGGFAEALRKLGPSHALLTPSFLRGLPMHDLTPIQTLMLVGEPPRRDEVDRWSSKLRLMNLYGPAECTILAAMQPQARPSVDPTNIGHPTAGTAWITNPQDPRRLAPIGAVGELLLQGPMVGRGYLNDPELTATAFLQAPPWLVQFGVGNGVQNGRVYRTGDLVRFEQDGTLVYLGRKDFQVKLRGQRLELSEVEDHVLRAFPGSLKDVAAEVVTPADARPNPCLVAFIAPEIDLPPSPSSSPSSFFPLPVVTPADFQQKIHTTHSSMHTCLPDYMVPAVFVPLSELPRTVGGKINRRRLREAAASVTRQQLEAVGSSSAKVEKVPMASDVERSLQGIWAEALGIARSVIGAEDSFFRLGGDSITALQATSQARAVAIEHSVPDLFRWKTIREIAKRFAKASGETGTGQELDHPLTARGDDNLGGVAVYPCTPVQRGVLLTQISDPSSYAPHFIWKIHCASPFDRAAVDPNRLAAAWKQVVNRHSALRTVFRRNTTTSDEVFELHILPQLDGPVRILPVSDTDSEGLPVRLTQLHTQVTQQGGQIPHEFAICPCKNGEIFCRLDINHAIIDAISVALLELDLLRVYEHRSPAPDLHDAYPEYLQYVHRQPQDPAREYWRTYLAGMQPAILPRSRADGQPASTPQRLEIPLACSGTDIVSVCHRTDWTPSNLLNFAWGLALGSLTGSDDVVFGTLTSGRHIPIPHIEQAVGQISNMAVCRVQLPSDRVLDEAAIALQEDYGRVLMFQSFPLSEISRACGITVQELASTAINVQYALSTSSCKERNNSISLTPVTGLDPTLQDVTIYALVDPQGTAHASMTYRESRISTDLATQLADYFAHFVAAILRSPHATVKELVGLTARDQHRLLQWNGPISPPSAECIHELIAQQAAKQPLDLAISSWDGDWTYGELDRAAVRLAASLVANGVKSSQYVPICSEKSPWTIVAALAVMKAGAGFVPLDPSHPFPRLRELCERVHATHMVSSVTQASLCLKLAEKVIVAGETRRETKWDVPFQSVAGDPEQPAYILFTSGTTGAPKGVMVPHSSYTAAAREQIRAFSMGPGSRVLQFSSYAFDVAVMEILTTLLAGGTVCVPSDGERDQMLLDGACPFAVTHAFLTPSVAATLDANRPGWVKTMILLGEPMSTAHITQWGEKCHLMNAYGPTECSVLNTSRAHIVPGCDPGNMGHALGVHFWVADQHDHGKLVPVGAVGELILGGPPVAQCYINDAQRTAEAFIQHPQWLKDLMPRPYPWRLYKTGDLVRYEISDGSLRYEGRKDRQIKIRGQRVELEEIEYHTRQCFPHASNAVVEHVMLPSWRDPASPGDSAALVSRVVACICHEASRGDSMAKASQTNESGSAELLLAPSTLGFQADAAVALARLRDAIPGYMVPDFFLPIRRVPRQKSGKTDRQLLREAITKGQAEFRWLDRTMPLGGKQYPRTEVESKLHAILARHLMLAPETVGIDENLFYLGGDSIVAMKIAASARESGLNISLYDILRRPTVLGWADAVLSNHSAANVVETRSAFCLISDVEYREVVRLFAEAERPVTEESLEDILPALESQAHYVESSSIVNFAEVFPTDLDPDRLRWACQEVVSRYSILRTVFCKVGDRLLQVILRHLQPEISLLQCDDAESYLTQQTTRRTTPATPLNSPLTSFGLVKSTTRSTSALVVRLSHAQYDGASLPFLWQAIKAAYHGDPLSDLTPFSHLVHYRKGRDHSDTAAFWRTYLKGASAAALDPLQIAHVVTPQENPDLSRTARRELVPPTSVSEATVATIVKAALSWILSRYASRSDIILGQVAHGRGSAIPNVHQILGPCVTFLPIRIAINREHTIAQFLQYVQLQQVLTVPHDSHSLGEIAGHCTDWPPDARFGCLVHHQATQSQDSFEMDGIPSCSSITWATSRPPPGQLNVISIERETTLDLVLAAPPNAIDQVLLNWLADRLADTIRLFSNVPACSLAALEQDGVECP